jgi:hypothetical protein
MVAALLVAITAALEMAELVFLVLVAEGVVLATQLAAQVLVQMERAEAATKTITLVLMQKLIQVVAAAAEGWLQRATVVLA